MSKLSDDELRAAAALALDRDADHGERQRAAKQTLDEWDAAVRSPRTFRLGSR